MKVAGKVCVVTGGASGIGKALATRFIAEGATAVVIADLNADMVSAVGAEIGAQAHALDVRDESAIAPLVESVEAEHGQVDLFALMPASLVLMESPGGQQVRTTRSGNACGKSI